MLLVLPATRNDHQQTQSRLELAMTRALAMDPGAQGWRLLRLFGLARLPSPVLVQGQQLESARRWLPALAAVLSEPAASD